MSNWYIEYSAYWENGYDESDSKIIEAGTKRGAIKKLKNELADDMPERIEIDTIYRTSWDARP